MVIIIDYYFNTHANCFLVFLFCWYCANCIEHVSCQKEKLLQNIALIIKICFQNLWQYFVIVCLLWWAMPFAAGGWWLMGVLPNNMQHSSVCFLYPDFLLCCWNWLVILRPSLGQVADSALLLYMWNALLPEWPYLDSCPCFCGCHGNAPIQHSLSPDGEWIHFGILVLSPSPYHVSLSLFLALALTVSFWFVNLFCFTILPLSLFFPHLHPLLHFSGSPPLTLSRSHSPSHSVLVC